MRAQVPEIPATAVLLWNLLDEPLIRWRSTDGGALHSTSLPQLLADTRSALERYMEQGGH